MRHHSTRALAAFVATTLLSPSIETFADPVAKLAEQAAHEFDILAPSVTQSAKSLLAAMDAHNEHNVSPPAIDWNIDSRRAENFVGPDGKLEAFWTEREYEVTAVDRSYAYRFIQIHKISRTGLRDYPFTAIIEIEVTTVDRFAKGKAVEPIPAPMGYRLATKEESHGRLFAGTISANLANEWIEGVDSVSYPIPHGPHVIRSRDDAPPAIKRIVGKLYKQSKEAKPRESRAVHRVELLYSMKDKAWRWDVAETEGQQ